MYMYSDLMNVANMHKLALIMRVASHSPWIDRSNNEESLIMAYVRGFVPIASQYLASFMSNYVQLGTTL